MGNADNNEDNSQPDSPGGSGGSRLPLQLGRLPSDRLERVHQAMEELKEAGLTDIKDLAILAQSVKKGQAAGNAKDPTEQHTSEYMGMTQWAWTPKRWFQSIEATGEPKGTKSEDLPREVEGDQLPAVPDSVVALCNKRSASSQFFKDWYQLMQVAEAEIRSMANMEKEVKTRGDGPGVWFEPTPSVKGSGVLARYQTPLTYIGGSAPAFAGRRGPSAAGHSGRVRPNDAATLLSIHLDEGLGIDCWQHVMKEHGVDTTGRAQDFYGCSQVLFSQSRTGRYVPRSIFAGSQKSMDTVSQAGMFDPLSIVVAPEGCSLETACDEGLKIPELLEAVRLQLERSDYVEGVLVSSTIGQDFGTSALQKAILNHVTMEMPKLIKVCCSCIPDCQVYLDNFASGLVTNAYAEAADSPEQPHRWHEAELRPSPRLSRRRDYSSHGHLFLAPYSQEPAGMIEKDTTTCSSEADPSRAAANAAISTRDQQDLADLVVLYDRTAVQKRAKAQENGLGLSSPSDADCRGVVARLFSGLTGPMRFARLNDDATPCSLWTYAQSLVPYPMIKYTMASLGGLGSPPSGVDPGLAAARAALLNGSLCTANFDRSIGKTISSTMICRGVQQCMALSPVITKRMDHADEWVDYCPGSVTITSFQDPKCTSPTVTMLENTSRVQLLVDHQVKGLDLESQQCQASAEIVESLQSFSKDLEEIAAPTCNEEGDEDEYEEE
ncbi:unnamed protein product [Durusdinium trenchii]|uniref:Beta-tubulin n=1 Tax=Durusdinium trenchii TaxID=1381693 RepID=A0ABP0S1D2_9DINO